MLASAKKVIKHKEKTTEYFSDLSTVFNTMQEHETRGVEIIERISVAAKAKNQSTTSASSSRQGICWRKAAKTFARIAQIDDTPETTELKHDRNRLFLEKISESLQLIMEVVNALAARKKIVDEYNHTLQSIARNQYKISSLGFPEAGPKREEKRRLELKVADYRVKKTTLFKKYETAKANMENELLWFHTELSKSLGSSLRLFVMTQGAEAGELHRSLLQI
jgi:division protein CdvB (Snf7/Vps24/ESCRT-III family)